MFNFVNTIRRPKRAFFWALLVIVVVFGGYLRYVGLNWDDFSALHPDERFLTLNLLPNMGGRLEFTPDEKNFPAQTLYVAVTDFTIGSQVDIQANPSMIVGVLKQSVGEQYLGWWLGEGRSRTYDAIDSAILALNAGEINALIVDQKITPVPNVSQIEDISSENVQLTRCLALNPVTNGIGGFFDTRCSSWNPHNATAGFYAYGTLPLFIAHTSVEAIQSLQNTYPDQIKFPGHALIWRFWSAFFDVGTIILVFFIGSRLHNRWVGIVAALLYACAPLAIAKAHYGTVNAITAFFVALAIWAAVCLQDRGRYYYYGMFGFAFGCALAGRINVLPLIGVLGLAFLLQLAPVLDASVSGRERTRILAWHVGGFVLALFVTLLVFRITNPYAFTGTGFFGVLPNSRFLDDLASSQFGISGMSDAPPNYQWVGRAAYIYPLKDIMLWGMGIASSGMMLVGCGWALWRLVGRQAFSTRNLLLVAWIIAYFGYMGRLWVLTMRYFLPLYSAFAIIAAWALIEIVMLSYRQKMPITRILLGIFGAIFALIPLYYIINGFALTTTAIEAGVVAVVLLIGMLLPKVPRAYILLSFTVCFSVLWSLMFTNIYRHQLTRIQAARWQYENVPSDFAMRVEGAPEGTPLINLAVPNYGDSATSPESLRYSATTYLPNAPFVVDFTAPASGQISLVYAPHLGDPADDEALESLYVSVSQKDEFGTLQLLAEQTLEANLTRENHVLGNAYEIVFANPFTVVENQTYTFKVEALNKEILGAGSVMLTEGDWDDRITTVMICTLPDGMTLADDPAPGLMSYQNCNGRTSAGSSLVQSYDMAMSYPIDDDLKRENIVDALSVGDYLAITSNRFYDSEARNLFRFPMTTRYYDALFSGELGYKLVGTFNTSYEFMGISVADQSIPTYGSPAWFNEFEADEAFHVYDHPVTFIFQKTVNYNHQAVQNILNSYPLTRSETQSLSDVPGSQILGVTYWDSLQMDAAPNGLMLATDQAKINQQGGTWSERFDSASVLNTNQVVGVVGWWLVMVVFGWVSFPIAYTIFPKLSDRGYGVSKFLGLFMVSYLAWVFASLKVPMWSQMGIGVTLLGVLAFSGYLAWQRRDTMQTYLRTHWRLLLFIEVITLVLFVALIGVRLTNPDIWHQWKGGEKPMDFAYFNAVLRTTTFPVSDPWFSGGYINYYYWGYVLVGSPILLLKIIPSFAYNLVIPTVFALAGIGAFSGAFNIVSLWNERRYDEPNRQDRRVGNPYLAGMAAILLCVVMGNLDTLRVLGNGIAQVGGYTLPMGVEAWLAKENPPITEQDTLELQQRAQANLLTDRIAYEVHNSTSLIMGLVRGVQILLSNPTTELPIGTDRWYWGPSRILTETPGVEGNAITEMPYFTFVYGDLHAHMLNMPVLLFVILFVFSELINARSDERTFFALILSVAIGGAVTGMIQAINTWDLPAFLVFGVVGLGYAWWCRFETINRKSLTFMVCYISWFVVAAFGASTPYRTWYAATYGSIQPWTQGKTPFWAYFDMWGLFLFLLVSLLVWETARWLRSVKVKDLRGWGNVLLIALVSGVLLFAFLVGVAALSYQVALMVVPLLVWIGILFFRPQQSPSMQFVLVITGLALALTLGVEVVVLGGDIGRQNTVFKFYIQAWILLSVAGGCAFAWLIRSSERWGNLLTVGWFVPLFVLVFIAGMFPIMATRGRSYDRMSFEVPLTLDGNEYMKYSTHNITYTSETVQLADDYAMIRWLQENVQGTPTIMEGRAVASEYTWTARIAINTGLPSVLGWRFHQIQQRTFSPMDQLIIGRENNVKFFYNSADIPRSIDILRFYNVRYIIVGGLEKATATAEGLAKIDNLVNSNVLTLVFEQGEGKIYQVNLEKLDCVNCGELPSGTLPILGTN